MSRLLIAFDSPGFGGSEVNLLRVLGFLHDVPISVIHGPIVAPEVNQSLDQNKLQRHRLPVGNSIRNYRTQTSAAKALLRNYPDAPVMIWAHSSDTYRWFQLCLARQRRPFVLVEQLVPTTRDVFRQSRLTIPLKRYVVRRASSVVLNAESQRGIYQSVYGVEAKPLRVIRNSRRIQDIHNQVLEHRKTHTTPKEMTVVCVARLSGQKNQAVLIDAWSQLPTPRPKLVLVGDGDDRAKLEQKILDQRLQTDVELVGHVNDPQPYLARGNVFILPSLAEGLPGALIEAMAAGLPCIATDIPGNNELVIHERTGLLVPVNDAPAVAAAVTRLMNHPDEAARLAAAGRKHMQEFFDEAVEREAWRNLAAEMLEAKP